MIAALILIVLMAAMIAASLLTTKYRAADEELDAVDEDEPFPRRG